MTTRKRPARRTPAPEPEPEPESTPVDDAPVAVARPTVRSDGQGGLIVETPGPEPYREDATT